MKRTPLISLTAMMIAALTFALALALATTACEKKNQDAEIAALHAQLEAAQAALETAKSGNATPEEIKKLEAAVATAAQQEAQAETRKTAATTPAATPAPSAPATPAATAPATTTTAQGQSATAPVASQSVQSATTPNAPASSTDSPAQSTAAAQDSGGTITTPEGFEFDRNTDLRDTFRTSGYRFSVSDQFRGDIVIPSSYNGVPVTEIGRSAFRGNYITSVTIPASVRYIGELAFTSFRLKRVTFEGDTPITHENSFWERTDITIWGGYYKPPISMGLARNYSGKQSGTFVKYGDDLAWRWMAADAAARLESGESGTRTSAAQSGTPAEDSGTTEKPSRSSGRPQR